MLDIDDGDVEVSSWSFDPRSESWWARVVLYQPAMLNDEAMRIHFHELDGKWSRQTAEAMARSGAKGLDLNSNWALTDVDWSCPACGREKRDLFRLTSIGCLLASLEIHHDHLPDTVWPRTWALFGKDWSEQAPAGTIEQIDTVEALIRRFRPTLLCRDCNAADATAKKGIEGVDRRFSFAPDEIASFISAKTGGPHAVDCRKATALWLEQRFNFEHRISLIDQLVQTIHAGSLATSHSVGTVRLNERLVDPADSLYLAFRRQHRHDLRLQVLEDLRAEFLTRSTSKDSLRFASKARRLPTPISDAEYASYCDPVSPRTWAQTSVDWDCPCCGRTKRETIRKGKTGRWSGGIRAWSDVVLESDPTEIENRRLLFPELAQEVFVRAKVNHRICSDCADAPVRIGQRHPEASQAHFNLADIRDCLLSITPNEAHEVDWERGRGLAVVNRLLSPAIRSLEALVQQASLFQSWLVEGPRRGYTIEEMRLRIRDELEYQIRSHGEGTMDRLIDWLATWPTEGRL